MYTPEIISEYVSKCKDYDFSKKLQLYKLCKKTTGDINLNISKVLMTDCELNRKKIIATWISLSSLMVTIDIKDSEIEEVLNEYR